MKILVTGANGFVGRELCRSLIEDGMEVRATVRSSDRIPFLPIRAESVVVGNVGPDTEWGEALRGVDVVIHTAARIPQKKETCANPLEEYLRINSYGTKQLLSQAMECPIQRFIYISSINVNGPKPGNVPFNEEDPPHPEGYYGQSKWEAEKILNEAKSKAEFPIVILRSPWIYGPGVRDNFLKLLRLIEKGVPMPFARLQNRLSFMYLGNLIDAIKCCLSHPSTADKTYCLSDGIDMAVSDLIEIMAKAMGRAPKLLSFPVGCVRLMGNILGKSAEMERIINPLRQSCDRFKDELGWKPPFTTEEGIAETVHWYLSQKKKEI